MTLTIEDITSFCKRKGFVYQDSEIYGGLSGFWDLGPLGVELMNNIKAHWWKHFVQDQESILGMDGSIISNPKVWEASGHLANFSDIAVTCKKCKKATKIDKSEVGKVKCDCGGEYASQGEFNLMFKTNVGALDADVAYMRGETAQGMFTNFKLIAETSRAKLPFGIAQIGKCFRNEIAPRDFIFRSREFTIGEFEFFIHPDENKCDLLTKQHLNLKIMFLDDKSQQKKTSKPKETTVGSLIKNDKLDEWHGYWLAEQMLWFYDIGLNKKDLVVREHTKDELSHYSSATFDIDYAYPFGSKEIAGNANRGQYDLTQHIKESGEKLEMYDEQTKTKVVPRVIEPTFGMERIFLAVLVNAYNYDKKRENVVLKLNSKLAPYKVGVFSLVNKLNKEAKEIFDLLKKEFHCKFDTSGAVGRRYYRADEQGVPYCLTFDFDSIKDKAVTIRSRDSQQQVRVKVKDLVDILRKLLNYELDFEKAGKLVE